MDDLKVRDETVLSSQKCYNILVIPEFRRLSWEGWEFKISLNYIEIPYLKKNERHKSCLYIIHLLTF